MKTVCIDFETTGLEFYREDFYVLSMAVAFRDADGVMQTRYHEGEDEIRHVLEALANEEARIVVHNVSFEYGCIKYRFPDLVDRLYLYADTMRMAQVMDNGGDEDYGPLGEADALAAEQGFRRPKVGLGLEPVVRRHLPASYHNHKERYYRILRDQGVKKGEEGANLDKLPKDDFIAYNVADALNTLRVYETLCEKFEAMNYDWRFDHEYYLFMARQISDAKARGVKIDRARACKYRDQLVEEIAEIDRLFRERFLDDITEIERTRGLNWANSLSTPAGVSRRLRQLEENPELFRFNVNSTQQLKELFVDRLGIRPQFFTDKGAPSFASTYLHQFGEGGEMLAGRKSKQLSLKQTDNLIELSDEDGRWHLDLKATGTKTGRFAGGRQDG